MNRNGVLAVVFGLALPIYVATAASSDRWGPKWFSASAFTLFPLAAAILGHSARRQTRSSAQLDKWGKTAGAVGLTLGYAEILICGLLLVITLALYHEPHHFEASAVGSLRTLTVSARGYACSHPVSGYPKRLADMQWDGTQTGADWGIDPTLASGVKAGYRFIYLPKDTKGNGLMDVYEIFADPLQSGKTGVRHFYTDDSSVIRWESGRPASRNSQPLQ